MPRKKLLIFTAVGMEARAVAGALGLPTPAGGAARGSVDGRLVELYVIGIGATRLPAAVDPADCLLLAGLAGALDPSLRVADVVVDGVASASLAGVPARAGRVHTAAHLVGTPQEKAALFHDTGALAVDMEGSAVRRFADAAGLPLVTVRAISDAADERVDPAVLALVDDVGRAKPGALSAALFRRPGLIPHLLRLRRCSRLACSRLGVVVRDLLTHLPWSCP